MLDEYAIRFYALLEQAFRLEAMERLEHIGIISVPHMEKTERQMLINRFLDASSDILETGLGNNDTTTDGISKLKKEFG